MRKLHINPKFESALPYLNKNEYRALEKSILEEGVRNPIIVWDNTIIDGHHRYKICIKHGIPFETVEKKFESEDEAYFWILREQFSRRNQTMFGRGITIGRYYNKMKKTKRGKNRKPGDPLPKMTSHIVAKIFGVSPNTVLKWGKIARHFENVIPELQQRFLTNEIPFRLIQVLMYLPLKEQQQLRRMSYRKIRDKYLPQDEKGKRRAIFQPLKEKKKELERDVEMKLLKKERDKFARENEKLRSTLEHVKAIIKKWNMESLFDIPGL